MPKQALTMGVSPIMHAKRILLLICGEEKCALLEKALNGPVTPRLPVSLLLLHPDVSIIKCQQAPDSLQPFSPCSAQENLLDNTIKVECVFA